MWIAITLIIIFLSGLIGNLLAIIVFMNKTKKWTPTLVYLINLSISDLLFVSTIPFWAYVYTNNMVWPFGLVLCKICGTVPTFNMFSSIFFLTAIAIDRWITMTSSKKSKSKRLSTLKRNIAIIWVLSFCLTLYRIPLMSLRLPYTERSEKLVSIKPEISNFSNISQLQFFTCQFFIVESSSKMIISGFIDLFKFTAGFCFPLIAITFCYIRIMCIVNKKTLNSSQKSPKKRILTLNTTLIVAFIICWLPIQTLNMLSAFGGWWNLFNFDFIIYNKIYPFSLCLAWSNSVVNPVLYAFSKPNCVKLFFNCFK